MITGEEVLSNEYGTGQCIDYAHVLRDRMYKKRCTMENDMWSALNEHGSPNDFKAYNDADTAGRARYCLKHAEGYRKLCVYEAALTAYIDELEGSLGEGRVVSRGEYKRIGFSHRYPKIHGQKSAKLLAVYPINITKNTSKELLEYDTAYDGGHFELKRGRYIQLVFIGDLGIPFCTIRPAFPTRKIDYYKGAIGEWFNIVYKGDPVKAMAC